MQENDISTLQSPDPSNKIACLFYEEIKKLHEEISTQKKINTDLSAKIKLFEEQIALWKHRKFAAKSEELSNLNYNLFDDIEPSETSPSDESEDTIVVPAHTRKKKSGRNPLPKDLEREIITHDLEDSEKVCDCCGGTLHLFGEDCSERLKQIPSRMVVEEHVRLKYICKNKACKSGIKMADMPKRAIPKSIATEELLTNVIISKYENHLPLYRQAKIYERLGVEIDRTNLSNWMFKCSELCEPLITLLKNDIQNGFYTNVDETPVKLIRENGKIHTSKSYMFVYVGGNRKTPSILFDYQPTRSGQSAENMLVDFQGYLQSDAFSGYDRFEKKEGITLVGCWVHARRKFYALAKLTKKHGLSHEGLKYITRLYKIEKAIKKESKKDPLSPDQIRLIRQEQSKQILDEFKEWLKKNMHKVPPKSTLYDAMYYVHNNWTVLIEYINDGRLAPDNNIAENAIRPFALGRKNWLFCGNEAGAKASATLYSLIETCKAIHITSYDYILHILKKLPYCDKHNPRDYEKLTPQAYKQLIQSQPLPDKDS